MRLSRKQLLAIKKQVKNNKSAEDEEKKTSSDDTVTLADAKKKIKEINAEDEEYKSHKSFKKEFRKIKRQARKDEKLNVTWNINEGDAVQYKDRSGNIVFGIVIQQRADGEYQDLNHAKWSGYIQVMSPSGNVWLSPKQIEKISE